MLFQFFTTYKGLAKFSYDFFFLLGKFIRRMGIYCREIVVAKPITFAVKFNCALVKIDFIKQSSVVHIVFGMLAYKLTFQFKLDNRNRLMCLHFKPNFGFVAVFTPYFKLLTGVVLICLHCKEQKG